MSASQNLYEGLFASINEKDETTVTYLFYANTTTYLKRYNKEWVPVDNIDDENTNGDEQIPVTDEFIEAFDQSQEDGVPLSIDDANEYLRELEPWE
jgi:hypothetical protein